MMNAMPTVEGAGKLQIVTRPSLLNRLISKENPI